MDKTYVIGWEYVNPSVGVAVAMLGAAPPYEPRFWTNVSSVAYERHAEMDIRLLDWLRGLGFDPNGAVRTWVEVK